MLNRHEQNTINPNILREDEAGTESSRPAAFQYMNEEVICNGCDTVMGVCETESYFEADTNWHGRKCPQCGQADDFADIDPQWAVDQLRTFAKHFSAMGLTLGRDNVKTWNQRLRIIADMIEAEIE